MVTTTAITQQATHMETIGDTPTAADIQHCKKPGTKQSQLTLMPREPPVTQRDLTSHIKPASKATSNITPVLVPKKSTDSDNSIECTGVVRPDKKLRTQSSVLSPGACEADGDDDSLACYRSSVNSPFRGVHRNVAPKIRYKTYSRTLSAYYAAANAICDVLNFADGELMGGHLAAKLHRLLYTVAPSADLWEKSYKVVTTALSPKYRLENKSDPSFNVWSVVSTYPVIVVVPHIIHGHNKVQGFAVAHQWIYTHTSDECIPLTVDNLAALGYLVPVDTRRASIQDGINRDETRTGPVLSHATCDVDYLDKKYWVVKKVKHFAIVDREQSPVNAMFHKTPPKSR